MSTITTNLKTKKFVAAAVGMISAVVMMGGAVVAPASAATVEELTAQINSLLSTIAALQSQLAGIQGGSGTGTGSCAYTFTQNLTTGSTGTEVMNLQKFLNMDPATQVSTSGAGSPGNETSYFGPATKAAVVKFQNKYASEVLAPVGLTAGTGYWGSSSRAKANSMCSGTGTGTGIGTGTGTGISVVAGAQPANSLAPQGASRVPFTTFTVTNNSGAAVTVTGVTVERTALGSDSVFSGITLVDSNNVQLGIAKTLNSNHQAVIGDNFTLNPGESKMLTVAGNMGSSLTTYAGQVVSLSVVAVNTTATVSGSLPITGAAHTVNATLSIGSVSTTTSAYDPGTTQSKNLGDTSVKFSGVKFTASSVEDIKLYSVRWRQTGTAAAGDLSNVMTYVDGVAYPTTVSSDGKYYTTVFAGGVLIEKGFSKDVYIQGDITGSGAAGRTVDFDIDKASDVYFVGQTYGYGIAVSGSYSPWYDGYQTSVNAGSATSITKANEVPAQNIAVNVPNVELGGFATEFKGEAVSVQSLTFTIATSGTGLGVITSIALYDENGAVVAGPADANAAGTSVTLSNTVTFPTGRHVYKLKGKLPSTFTNNGTVTVSTVPNSTNWTNATGQTSGNTISLPGNTVTMNVMTVKAGAVNITVSASPTNQTVVSGVNGFTVANYQIDTTQSGEDIRFNNFKLDYDETSLSTGDPVNCFLWDGSTRLNSSAVNPTTNGTEYTASFDTVLVVPKGTLKTIAAKCDLPASLTTGSFAVGLLASGGSTSFTGTGVLSGQTITPTGTTNAGATLSISSGGTLTVTKDSSSPAYAIAAAGTSNVTLGILRIAATDEPIDLKTVALQLTSASSSPSDLTEVSLWDGATKIGTTLFAGGSDNATTTITTTTIIPANSYKLITVKGNLASIGTSLVGTQGALLKVNWDGNDSTGTRGTGQSSGSAVYATGSDTDVDGVRVFKTYPTVAQLSIPSSTLTTQTGVVLTRFSVKANAAGGLGIGKFTINVATSTVNTNVSGTTTVTNLKVYAFTDSGFSSPISGFTDGQVVATIANLVSGDNDAVVQSPSEVNIPMDTTYYFEVRGDVALTAGTGTFSGYVTTKLIGDSAYLVDVNTLVDTLANVDGQGNDNFIWSPNATTTSETTHADWANGYFVSGLPSAGLSGSTLSK